MRLATLLTLLLLVATAAGLLWTSPHGYATQQRLDISSPASRAFPAGTDEMGRDRAVRSAAALLLGFAGASAASLLASSLSLLLGGSAALCPPWLGRLLLYGGDLFLTLPWIFLLMLIRAALPLSMPSLQSAAITFSLLAVLGAPAFLRVTHRRVTSLLSADWLFHARASGLHGRYMVRHTLPHLRSLFWTQFVLYIPVCLMAEANLGTLGLGIAEPLPSWGNMLGGLQSAALISPSRLIYLPLGLLVLVLALLELTLFGAKSEA